VTNIQFPNQLFGPGTFSATVKDNNGAPSTVLEAGATFTIDAEWEIDALAALLLGGQWEVAAYVESIGPGAEQQVGSTEIVLLDGRTTPYTATITVPAGTLPNDPAPPEPGVYKLVTVLTHRNFNKVTNVAAIVEGPMVRIG
jgi:hypothetical protein